MTETPDLRCVCCGDILHPFEAKVVAPGKAVCGPCGLATEPPPIKLNCSNPKCSAELELPQGQTNHPQLLICQICDRGTVTDGGPTPGAFLQAQKDRLERELERELMSPPAMPAELVDALVQFRIGLMDTDRRWAWGLAARYHGTGGTTEEFRACVRQLGEQLLADLLAARAADEAAAATVAA